MKTIRLMSAGLAIAAALALSGCITDGSTTVGTTPTVPIGTAAPTPSKVKQLVMKGCGYVPDLIDVAAVLTASPFVPAAEAVANAICLAATNIPFADGPGDHLPRVNDVAVHGYFVKARLK